MIRPGYGENNKYQPKSENKVLRESSTITCSINDEKNKIHNKKNKDLNKIVRQCDGPSIIIITEANKTNEIHNETKRTNHVQNDPWILKSKN